MKQQPNQNSKICYNETMKRIRSLIFSLVLILVNFLVVSPAAHADANNFRFSDAVFDYNLKKTETGSELEVTETLTAEFPNYNQNHGIERAIPFLNQNDTNLTVESVENFQIKVERNGEYEPYTIKDYDDHFIVRIGRANEYVKGTQVYTLKYKFVNVITEFEASHYAKNAYQELYWDSNGTGWYQPFDKVTVNLHFDNELKDTVIKNLQTSSAPSYFNKAEIHENNKTKEKLAAWCYVGRYGSGNQNRCEISDLEDGGVRFEAVGLATGENMTFALNFLDKTFTVPKNDFIKKMSYKDFKIDYYLDKDSDGVSRLRVKEDIIARFPTATSGYQFERIVPFVDSTKTRFVTDSQDTINIKATIDGEEVSPRTITTDDNGFFNINFSDYGKYVHGEHHLTLEYELRNVITDNKNSQHFWLDPLKTIYYEVDNAEATLHMGDELKNSITIYKGKDLYSGENFSEKAWCSDATPKPIKSQRCKTTENADGYTFSVSDIDDGHYFIFYVYFNEGTFKIPPANKNYLCWHIFIGFMIIAAAIVIFAIYKNYAKVSSKIKYLRGLPVVPEYTPYKDMEVAEIGENYLKPTKNSKVATMLELIVNKKIELRKEKKSEHSHKYNWYVKVLDVDNITSAERYLLRILKDGKTVAVGDEIKIEHHSYSSKLEDAFDGYDTSVKRALYLHKIFEMPGNNTDTTKKRTSSIALSEFFKVIGILCVINFGAIFLIGGFWTFADWYVKATGFTPFSIYEGLFLIPIICIIAFLVFLFVPILSIYTDKYKKRTEHGLEVSRYTDGLKLYIKMAEADRLKFLQSIEGVDTSESGIVKLHEKLLPYAALFGLEKSWMKELKQYYELEKVETPDWIEAGFNYAIINSVIRDATHRPIDISSSMSSSGWSSSSGSGGFSSSSSSSGGGGGGFSGGGGGGGGGGGW